MYSISIFLFYIVLIREGGCVRTQPPCLRACQRHGMRVSLAVRPVANCYIHAFALLYFTFGAEPLGVGGNPPSTFCTCNLAPNKFQETLFRRIVSFRNCWRSLANCIKPGSEQTLNEAASTLSFIIFVRGRQQRHIPDCNVHSSLMLNTDPIADVAITYDTNP